MSERLQHAGFAAFWVGGCVRDFLLGREPQDYDIATDARPEQVEKLFKRTIAVGRKFGVMIVVEGKQQFQVATFRAEADYRDGRRPAKVVFSSAEADAQRRDFTVNGLFYDPLTEKIHDWVGGEKDLRAKIIRTIGAPEERFAEDHLRLLRAVRFAAQLDFEIEPQTFAAVKTLAPKIKLISAERIRDELIKLFAPPHNNFSLSSGGGEGRGGEADVSMIQSPSPRPSPRLGGAREKCRTRGSASLPNLHHRPRAVWCCCATADCWSKFCRNWRRRFRASNRRIIIPKAPCSSTSG